MGRFVFVVVAIFTGFSVPATQQANAGYTYKIEENPPGPEGACHRIIAACADETGNCLAVIIKERQECHKADRDPCVAAEASTLHNDEWPKIQAQFNVTFSGHGWEGMDLLNCK